jgi:hypothetical protein
MNWDFLSKAIAITADIMTIIGLSGILTWSIFHKESRLADKVLEIFAYSIKTFFCLIIFSVFYLIFIVLFAYSRLFLTGLTGVSADMSNFWWSSKDSIGVLLAYLIAGLIAIPLFIISCACIFQWSFNPFKGLLSKFKRNNVQ